MCQDSYDSVLELAESSEFDIYQCINALKDHTDNIGVNHFLVKQLYRFSYCEIEFCIAQFIQLLVNFETNSMALIDFLLEQSAQYPHFCLITFWNLQAYVHELKNEPDTYSFHVVRNFINELQNLMFNQEELHESLFMHRHHSFRENLQPSLAICGAIASSFALPQVNSYVGPIIQAQGKQQKTLLFKLANFHKTLTRNLTLKNRALLSGTGNNNTIRKTSRPPKSPRSFTNPIDPTRNAVSIDGLDRKERFSDTFTRSRSSTYSGIDEELNYLSDYSLDRSLKINTKIVSKKKSFRRGIDKDTLSFVEASLDDRAKEQHIQDKQFSHSLPDLRGIDDEVEPSIEDMAITPVLSNSSSASFASLDIHDKEKELKNLSFNSRHLPPTLYEQKVKLLQTNYFKKETEFMMALQNISMRLSLVPKEARLTSLRAELSIINKSVLPSEIDIPQLLPPSSKHNKKFHKILKLNVNEACVLNSAERVPFLLLIEYLSEEMDFDPTTDHNRIIINNSLNADYASSIGRRSRVVSAAGSQRESAEFLRQNESFEDVKSMDEADLGDMSVVAISNEQNLISHHLSAKQAEEYRYNVSKSAGLSPQVASNATFKPEVEGQRSMPSLSPSLDTGDLSAQMRIAAVMLQQLEKSGQTDQAASIKNRIIESMKALQDKFDHIDYGSIKDIHFGRSSSDAGERKLENDFKLSEDWATKKNRIRQASAYGHLKNWDLCSVIAKNGDDLPQEAFACQLISIISSIWKASNVSVWAKNMKILITSASTGLVETINNAMSIHSIKKTLTDLTEKRNENSRGVASLKDYFSKVYGPENSYRYRKAQDNFSRSLAAYSIICYVLQIKDRHNGNIMLDNEGHIIHIDFGFLLSNSPGSMGFEAAPFKLTFEYVEVLGGLEGAPYLQFKELCKSAFRVLRENCDHLVNIVDLMQKDSSLPCFKNGSQTSILLKQRLQLDLSPEECDQFVETSLIAKSLGSVYTRLYDQFQLLTQGIYN